MPELQNIKVTKKKPVVEKQNRSFEKIMSYDKVEAIEIYGTPIEAVSFMLNDVQGEFRIGLYNIYTKTERTSENIKISELTWEKDIKHYITIWYQELEGKTIPKDSLIWEKGSEF